MSATLQRSQQQQPTKEREQDGAAPSAPSRAGLLPPLEAELQRTPASNLQPEAFFVSWQGVLTLAYSGFPAALIDLKERIASAHPSLPAENPGSKWPKTSLGCLREGQRLTPEQLAALCRICREESRPFQQRAGGEAPAARPPTLHISSACVAVYECRSLERLLSCQTVPLRGGRDGAPPSEEERRRVAAILAEPDAPSYWFAASRDGNREVHYRGLHLGATLMHPLLQGAAAAGDAGRPALEDTRLEADAADRRQLLAAVAAFRRRVDAELPGMYCWFSDESLHVTLRALIN